MPLICKRFATILLVATVVGFAGCSAHDYDTDYSDAASSRHSDRRGEPLHPYWRRTDDGRAERRYASAAAGGDRRSALQPALRTAPIFEAKGSVAPTAAEPVVTLKSTRPADWMLRVPPPIDPVPAPVVVPADPPAMPGPDGRKDAIGTTPGPPPVSTTDANAAARAVEVLERARQTFLKGDVLAAREALLSLFPHVRAEALLELARTYDPHYLSFVTKPNVGADAERARVFYEQAQRLGAPAASVDLHRLLKAATEPPRN